VTDLLLALHVAGAGIWLGMDFGTFMSFKAVRNPDLSIDQRVQMARYFALIDMGPRTAVVAMLALGVWMMTARNLGFTEGIWGVVGPVVGFACILWVAAVWWLYWAAHPPAGTTRPESVRRRAELVKRLDLGWRVVVVAVIGAAGILTLTGDAGPTDVAFLGWKMLLYAGIVALGLGIRTVLPGVVATMGEIFTQGSTPEREAALAKGARPTQGFVIGIWALIGLIIWLSIDKPL
jgi:hypothetical protein